MRRLGAVSPQPPAWRAARYPSSLRSGSPPAWPRRWASRGRGRGDRRDPRRRDVDRDEDAAATKRSSCRSVGGGTCAEDSPEVVVLLERGDEPVFVAGSLAWG